MVLEDLAVHRFLVVLADRAVHKKNLEALEVTLAVVVDSSDCLALLSSKSLVLVVP